MHHNQSSKNYYFTLCLLSASFYSKSRSSPRMRYIMKRVTPTYQAKNIMPYIQILALTDLDFILGSSSSENRCLAQNSSTEGMGPPVLKSRFFTVCPLKFFFYVCYLGGKKRVVSNLLNTLRTVSLSLFINTINISYSLSGRVRIKDQDSCVSALFIFNFMWSIKAPSIADKVLTRFEKSGFFFYCCKYFSTFLRTNLPYTYQSYLSCLWGDVITRFL